MSEIALFSGFRFLKTGLALSLAIAGLAGCAQDIPVPNTVTDVTITEAEIADFPDRRGAINAQRERDPEPIGIWLSYND